MRTSRKHLNFISQNQNGYQFYQFPPYRHPFIEPDGLFRKVSDFEKTYKEFAEQERENPAPLYLGMLERQLKMWLQAGTGRWGSTNLQRKKVRLIEQVLLDL